MQSAWKVGLLVVVFSALLLSAFVFLGASFFKKQSQVFYADLADAGGVATGTKILMSGVRVGQVSKVELKTASIARLTLDIDKGVVLPLDSAVKLPASLLSLGDNPMVIIPGKRGGSIAPGSVMPGSKATVVESTFPELKNLLEKANETMEKFGKVASSVQRILDEGELLDKVQKLVDSSNEAAKNVAKITDHADRLLTNNEGNITGALTSFRKAIEDVQKSTSLVSQIIKDGKYNEKIESLVAGLNKTTADADKLVNDMRDFVTNPKMRAAIDASMENVATMTDSGTRIAADTEKIAKNGVEITAKVSTFADKANDLADSAKGALDQLKKIIGRAPATDKFKLTANLDVLHESDPNRWRTDIETGFSVGPTRLHAGIFDAFETNKITLQAGQFFNAGKGEIRYGIYASKPGLGVEYEIARGLALRADVFDINNPRGDVRARFDLGGGFYGWLGAQQLFRRNSLTVGIGFKK